jgi:hypothetical protein
VIDVQVRAWAAAVISTMSRRAASSPPEKMDLEHAEVSGFGKYPCPGRSVDLVPA